MAKIRIVIPCDEANHVCDKTQYKNATLWEKIKLNIHLLYCRACREYTKNNTKLSKAIAKSKVECLDKCDKEKMKQKLEEAINEHRT
ncbi:hypothetical protein [Aestuariivivens sediminis]|uniref:hypothetical protein n=1 Tax=Aestuariivivens sediminis TaxID=2913557 RepID=UPI001F561B21|nr:hypothetical protein [Aestuariivivens sediminis]